jgi:hypothetical protein
MIAAFPASSVAACKQVSAPASYATDCRDFPNLQAVFQRACMSPFLQARFSPPASLSLVLAAHVEGVVSCTQLLAMRPHQFSIMAGHCPQAVYGATVTCDCPLVLQLWDFGSGRLLTNLSFYQPQQDACMLYAARFGPPGCAAEGLLAAGGSGKQPVLRLYNKVRHLRGWLRAELIAQA